MNIKNMDESELRAELLVTLAELDHARRRRDGYYTIIQNAVNHLLTTKRLWEMYFPGTAGPPSLHMAIDELRKA